LLQINTNNFNKHGRSTLCNSGGMHERSIAAVVLVAIGSLCPTTSEHVEARRVGAPLDWRPSALSTAGAKLSVDRT
jgi:hypothetical protein